MDNIPECLIDNIPDKNAGISEIISVEIAKLSLKPGDVLVLKAPYSASIYDIEKLAIKLGKLIPNEVKGIWMRDDIELEVISPEESKE